MLSGIGVGDERLEIDRKLDLAPSGQFPTHHQPDQQIGRRSNLPPPGFKSRQVLRGHPKLLSEHFPAHHELFSQEPDLRSRQHGPLSDQQVHEQSMELFSVRNLDFLVSVTAFPDRCVDQLHVVQPRLPIVDRRVDKLLGCSTIGAPPRRSFAPQFQNPVTIVMRAHAGSSATTTVRSSPSRSVPLTRQVGFPERSFPVDSLTTPVLRTCSTSRVLNRRSRARLRACVAKLIAPNPRCSRRRWISSYASVGVSDDTVAVPDCGAVF